MAQLAPGAFPPPPPFYKLYAVGGPNPPPPPPLLGEFRVFGRDFSVDDPVVTPLQAGKLFQTAADGSIDFKGELSHLQGELMCLFLELLRTLVQNPSGYAPQLTMINQVFSNMQHLINALRPHQARANLEYALQLQIQAHKDALARIAQQVAAADTTLAQFAAALGAGSSRPDRPDQLALAAGLPLPRQSRPGGRP
ncbi:MAG: hypothetical protein WDW38_002300 [Sanguina aurantia]